MDPTNNPQQFFQSLLDAIVNRQWWPLASLALIGVIALVRWLAPKLHGRLGTWLNTDRGATVLTIVLGILGAVATTIGAWKAPDLKLLLTTVFTTVFAPGTYVLVKRLISPSDAKSGAGSTLALLLGLSLASGAGGCAWAKCELGKLPQTAEAIIASVVAIASNSSNAVNDLIDLGKQIGPGQVDCVVEALAANGAPASARAQSAWSPVMMTNLRMYQALRRSQGAQLCNPRHPSGA